MRAIYGIICPIYDIICAIYDIICVIYDIICAICVICGIICVIYGIMCAIYGIVCVLHIGLSELMIVKYCSDLTPHIQKEEAHSEMAPPNTVPVRGN